MKTIRPLILFFAASLLFGCSEKKAQVEQTHQDADAKARADAERKEMDSLPQTFKPRYNKKLDANAPKGSGDSTTSSTAKNP